jgi:TonB family protein
MIPDTVIDGAFRLGGQNAKPTPAPPPPPAPPIPESRPAPKPPEVKKTEPEPPKNKEVKKETDPLELAKPTKKKTPEVSTTLVPRKKDSPTPTKNTAESDNKARELADARQRTKDALNAARDTIKSSMSSSTTVVLDGGGYGEAVASYAQVVKSIYEHAWLPPDDAASDDAITKVTVTISRDGKVIDSHITRASGDSLVDHSVQRTLDRIDFIRPFPEGSKDKQRTYTINFNLKAKRALG